MGLTIKWGTIFRNWFFKFFDAISTLLLMTLNRKNNMSRDKSLPLVYKISMKIRYSGPEIIRKSTILGKFNFFIAEWAWQSKFLLNVEVFLHSFHTQRMHTTTNTVLQQPLIFLASPASGITYEKIYWWNPCHQLEMVISGRSAFFGQH